MSNEGWPSDAELIEEAKKSLAKDPATFIPVSELKKPNEVPSNSPAGYVPTNVANIRSINQILNADVVHLKQLLTEKDAEIGRLRLIINDFQARRSQP